MPTEHDALEDHEGTVSIGGRTITNLRFADDIDGLDGQEQELGKLVDHLEEASPTLGLIRSYSFPTPLSPSHPALFHPSLLLPVPPSLIPVLTPYRYFVFYTHVHHRGWELCRGVSLAV